MGVADVMGLVTSEVEVTAKQIRRRYTAEYKHRILREADAYTSGGEVGALLRRGEMYSSKPHNLAKAAGKGGDCRTIAQEARAFAQGEKPPGR